MYCPQTVKKKCIFIPFFRQSLKDMHGFPWHKINDLT